MSNDFFNDNLRQNGWRNVSKFKKKKSNFYSLEQFLRTPDNMLSMKLLSHKAIEAAYTLYVVMSLSHVA